MLKHWNPTGAALDPRGFSLFNAWMHANGQTAAVLSLVPTP
jgi:hypothetical protein